MKNKIILVTLIFCLLAIIVPCTALAFEDVAEIEYADIKYQLFSDGTAKIISIEQQNHLAIWETVLHNGEEYKITSINANAFNNSTEEKELYIYADNIPKLESGNSLENISAIYIPKDAKGFTKEAGWPTEKLKYYKIETQPQDTVVTAGEISDTDKLYASASIPVNSGSIGYNWYYCDKDGNITDNNSISSVYDFQIPKDLTYDNENNTSKDYYFICIVGWEGDILEPTRVAKVTVKPGTYKVFFDANWDSELVQNPITIPVNSERKISKNSIPNSSEIKLEAGQVFLGWTIDGINKIEPSELIYSKNTSITPLFGLRINFDANNGKFSDGSETFVTSTKDYYSEIPDLVTKPSEPTREGYEFIGFFDKKTGGLSLNDYYEMGGLFSETTFYAQWKAVPAEETDESENNDSSNDNSDSENSSNDLNSDNNSIDTSKNSNTNIDKDTNNPKTGDTIMFVVALLGISVVAIISTIKFGKNKKDN